MTTRFDLEQQILSCWSITDDLEVLAKAVLEHDNFIKDDMANVLIGLKIMYNLRFDEMFKTFENLDR